MRKNRQRGSAQEPKKKKHRDLEIGILGGEFLAGQASWVEEGGGDGAEEGEEEEEGHD